MRASNVITIERPSRSTGLHVARKASGSMFFRVKRVYTGSDVHVSYAFLTQTFRPEDDGKDEQRKAQYVYMRAKQKIHDRVLSLRATHLLTLTYRDNVEDLDLSRKHLRLFWRIVRRKFPQWKFVGVAEFQKRGAVHWHLALEGFQDVHFLRSCWQTVLAADGFEGNIDVKFFQGKSSAVIANYISKYLGKGFEVGDRPHYSHYYVTSRGLVVDTLIYHVFGYSDEEIQAFAESLVAEQHGLVRSRWRSATKHFGVESGGMATW